MGYYSTLSFERTIKTNRSQEEINTLWEKFKSEQPEDRALFLEQYSFEKDTDGTIRLETEDYCSKHYSDGELAQFISTIIEEGHFILEFVGEDNSVWGYYITPNSVKEIEYIRMVDGKLI